MRGAVLGASRRYAGFSYVRNLIPKKEKGNGGYQADSIQVLKGLEAVRRRPAMYIGSVSARGLHHLVYEVVDNSVDEALAGFATDISVTIHPDNAITVVDNGRGIPVDIHKTEKKPGVEVALTVLHAGGKFDKSSYTETRFDYATIANRLRELAFLNKALTIVLKDERKGSTKEETFYYKGG